LLRIVVEDEGYFFQSNNGNGRVICLEKLFGRSDICNDFGFRNVQSSFELGKELFLHI